MTIVDVSARTGVRGPPLPDIGDATARVMQPTTATARRLIRERSPGEMDRGPDQGQTWARQQH